MAGKTFFFDPGDARIGLVICLVEDHVPEFASVH